MIRSKLPNSVLRRIWALSDIDEDGMLDRDEFAVSMFLIDHKLAGNDIPETLPDRVIPPSKRSHLRAAAKRGGVGRQASQDTYNSGNGSYSYSSRPMDKYEDDVGLGSYVDQP